MLSLREQDKKRLQAKRIDLLNSLEKACPDVINFLEY